mmetsp:Transcript_13859/g.22579  ORF Transcript_13859/g.22579 Transcript_13859/m.22579 type:complete len:84 (-) Transcript_13859:60-311(-)
MSDAATTHSHPTTAARTKMANLIPSRMPCLWTHLGPHIQMIYHQRPLGETQKSGKNENLTTSMQPRAMPNDSGKDEKLTSSLE